MADTTAASSGGRVPIGEVEKELLRLWDRAADPGTELARTLVMTLIAICPGSSVADEAARTALAVAGEHPAKAIIINTGGEAGDDVSAEVTVACRMASYSDKHLCCEQVRIDTAKQGLSRVISAALPMALSDLPVAVWFPAEVPDIAEEAERLASASDRLLLDSALAGDNGRALLRKAEASSGLVVADLAWVRLAAMRLAVARLFDPESRRQLLSKVSDVEVSHCGARHDAMLFGAWVASTLGWDPGTRSVAVDQKSADQTGILGVRLSGDGFSFEVSSSGESEAELDVSTPDEQSKSTARLDTLTPAQAFCGALEVVTPDEVYARSLEYAAASGGL